MAKSRDDMVASAKRLAGMENTTFVPDADWAEWIERGIEDLWGIVVDSHGADYFTKTTTISLVADTEDYNLPSDFYELINMNVQIDGKRVNVEKFEWSEEASLRNMTLLRKRLYYRIIGTSTQAGTHQVKFLPVPDQAHTVHLVYSYKPAFASGTDTIDGILGWEEYAELVAAIKAINKEGSDTSGLYGDLARVKNRVMIRRGSRDKHRPGKIKDVRRDRWRRYRGRYSDDII